MSSHDFFGQGLAQLGRAWMEVVMELGDCKKG